MRDGALPFPLYGLLDWGATGRHRSKSELCWPLFIREAQSIWIWSAVWFYYHAINISTLFLYFYDVINSLMKYIWVVLMLKKLTILLKSNQGPYESSGSDTISPCDEKGSVWHISLQFMSTHLLKSLKHLTAVKFAILQREMVKVEMSRSNMLRAEHIAPYMAPYLKRWLLGKH